MILVNGVENSTLPVADRGLQYGDGVWETIAVRAGKAKMLDEHLARLQRGLQVLDIPFAVMLSTLKVELATLVNTYPDGVLKVIVTRGAGGRGYAYDANMHPTRILSTHPLPHYPERYQRDGVKLALCTTRLGHNPALAGFKHLNRLEQVMARAELPADCAEGLVMDYDDNIIEGTMSNLFVVVDEHNIITPSLASCGIQGIARSCIINALQAVDREVVIRPVSVKDIREAQGMFLSNSIIRLWPVAEFNGKHYQVPEMTRQLQGMLESVL